MVYPACFGSAGPELLGELDALAPFFLAEKQLGQPWFAGLMSLLSLEASG